MKHIEKTNYLKGKCVYRTQSNRKQFHVELSQLQYKKEGNKCIVSMSQKQITDLIKEVHDYNLTSASVSPHPF